MHHDEWLKQAKAVPVGQKRRVYHGGEMSKAMDVYNNTDSWSCYCHRCHTGAKMYKEYVEKVDSTAPVHRRYLDTKSLITLDKLDKQHYKRVVYLLHTKGVSTPVIAALQPKYNLVDHRLVFRFKGVDIGRETLGASNVPKWLRYDVLNAESYVYLQGSNRFNGKEPVILCEDLFSAQKIRFYTGWSALVLLGTNFKNEIAYFLMNRHAVIATDGDAAGWKAARNITRRCSLFGIQCSSVVIPDGLDPKDLPREHLINLFKHLEN